jgi:hypothetical protein
MASNVIGGFRKLGARFVGGDVRAFFETHVVSSLWRELALAFWFIWFLYRRKIFLRV